MVLICRAHGLSTLYRRPQAMFKALKHTARARGLKSSECILSPATLPVACRFQPQAALTQRHGCAPKQNPNCRQYPCMENSSTRHCHSMSAPTCQRRRMISCLQAIQETSPATLLSPDISRRGLFPLAVMLAFQSFQCSPRLPTRGISTIEVKIVYHSYLFLQKSMETSPAPMSIIESCEARTTCFF